MPAPGNLKFILEAALLAAGRPLSLDALMDLFSEDELPERKVLREALESLAEDYAGRGIEVREVASGWRIQVRRDYASWVSRLWDEKPGRYSRATMETLALIAYRQPITRGEIEDIRGVSVSTNIVKTLLEREWVRVLGHRDVPGKPALYGTTREFLDYFNLKSLDDLPTLAEIRDLEEINRELALGDPPAQDEDDGEAAAEAEIAQAADADGKPVEAPPGEAGEIEEEPIEPEEVEPEQVESEEIEPEEVPPVRTDPGQADAEPDEELAVDEADAPDGGRLGG
jgi:segregation and condensation protein B